MLGHPQQVQVGEALARRGTAHQRQVQVGAAKPLGQVERAARAQVEARAGRLRRRRGSDRGGQDQRGADRAGQLLGIVGRFHAVRGAQEQLVLQGAAQPGQGVADRELAHVGLGRRADHVARLRHGVEHDEQVEVKRAPVHAGDGIGA